MTPHATAACVSDYDTVAAAKHSRPVRRDQQTGFRFENENPFCEQCESDVEKIRQYVYDRKCSDIFDSRVYPNDFDDSFLKNRFVEFYFVLSDGVYVHAILHYRLLCTR